MGVFLLAQPSMLKFYYKLLEWYILNSISRSSFNNFQFLLHIFTMLFSLPRFLHEKYYPHLTNEGVCNWYKVTWLIKGRVQSIAQDFWCIMFNAVSIYTSLKITPSNVRSFNLCIWLDVTADSMKNKLNIKGNIWSYLLTKNTNINTS